MRDIPDAPWIGLCREDYYGYDEIEDDDDEIDEEDEDDELYG